MKILITGKHGYIANKLYDWLKKNHPYFTVDKKSVRNGLIPSLSGYNTIIHTAAIVHKSFKMPLSAYLKVNDELTMELALKAKDSGVKHFIFLSTMAVYGVESVLDKPSIITNETIAKPTSSYGISKLQAENNLKSIETEHFKIAIIRPPMVYGKGAPGNSSKLYTIAGITPIFPKVDNQRSMININNLCQLINLIITFKSTGIFHPQDEEYINTSNLVQVISPKGKNVHLSEFMGSVVTMLDIPIIRKTFGNLVYNKDMSEHFEGRYRIYPAKNKQEQKQKKVF